MDTEKRSKVSGREGWREREKKEKLDWSGKREEEEGGGETESKTRREGVRGEICF